MFSMPEGRYSGPDVFEFRLFYFICFFLVPRPVVSLEAPPVFHNKRAKEFYVISLIIPLQLTLETHKTKQTLRTVPVVLSMSRN